MQFVRFELILQKKIFKLNKCENDEECVKLLNELDETRKIINEQIYKRTGPHYTPLYLNYKNTFESNLKYPDGNKWLISFKEPIINDDGQILYVKKDGSEGFINFFGFNVIMALANKESKHLNNPLYFSFFETFLQLALFTFGVSVKNMEDIIKKLVSKINEQIGYTYIVINCKNGLSSYGCGRAVSSVHKLPGQNIPRLVIYNTVGEDDDTMDYKYYEILSPGDPETLNLEHGNQSNYYKQKYLKYKQKYLQLKKQNL